MDILEIDRALVAEVEHDVAAPAVVAAITRLARVPGTLPDHGMTSAAPWVP